MEEMKSDGKGSRSDFLGPRFRALSKSRINGKYCKWRLQAWNREVPICSTGRKFTRLSFSRWSCCVVWQVCASSRLNGSPRGYPF